MPVTRRLGERALNIGVPEALYQAAQRVADKEAQSLAAITRRALADYVRLRCPTARNHVRFVTEKDWGNALLPFGGITARKEEPCQAIPGVLSPA